MEDAGPEAFPAENFRRVETLVATASSLLCTLGSLPQGLSPGLTRSPSSEPGQGQAAWNLTSRALERALGGECGRPQEMAACGHATATLVEPGERDFLAACMSGGGADDPAAWPSAHRTEWLLSIDRRPAAQHRLHVESLAAELRVSCVLQARARGLARPDGQDGSEQ